MPLRNPRFYFSHCLIYRFCAKLLCLLLLVVGETNGGSTSLLAQAPLTPRLELVIIEGDGAINNIKQRTAREPIVQVEDENHKPVAGVAVLFALPTSGPGATFAQGARSATFFSDQNGRVVARGLRVNRATGRYQIRVSASSGGRTATTLITQTNVAAAVGATAATGLSLKVILILAAAAAGTAGGVYAATHTGGGSSANPGTAISIGSPTVGAPK